MFPKHLKTKLDQRRISNAFRHLGSENDLVDFSSNDYLGLAKSDTIYNAAQAVLKENNLELNGATGSRLLSGNHKIYDVLEGYLSDFCKCEKALVFNSGYTANLGFFSCVPQRNDIILYDELVHASIREGLRMSNAKAFKFKHNNLKDLETKISRYAANDKCIYVITESVFSMDGDAPDLVSLAKLCVTFQANLVVDEAHAIGVFGNQGEGLVQHLGLEDSVFARIVTFGKALGCHGAAILGSAALVEYLINFSKPFIYTTGLSPHAVAAIYCAFNEMTQNSEPKQRLHKNIAHFKSELKSLNLQDHFIDSLSAIQSCIVSGNNEVKALSQILKKKGYDVKAILSPTVPEGKERLRFCIHNYNTEKEISEVLTLLSQSLSIKK